jgi:hypothetical protein
MLSTLVLTVALSLTPGQNGALALSNARTTLGGILGPRRPDSNYLPGDVCYLAFDIENLKLTADGTAEYSLGLEVTDAAGKAVYSAKPAGMKTTLLLGGSKLPASAFFYIQPNQPPGGLTCTLTVNDLTANAKQTVATKITVIPQRFGLIGVTAYHDEGRTIAAPLQATEGDSLWLMFGVVGFGRAGKPKLPDLVVEVRVLEQGTSVNKQPLTITLNAKVIALNRVEVNEDSPVIDLGTYRLPLNRAGKFTVEIKAECKVTGKIDTVTLPLTVTPAAK